MKMRKLYSLLLAFAFAVSALCSVSALSPETVFAAQNQQTQTQQKQQKQQKQQTKQQKTAPQKKSNAGKYILDHAGVLSQSDLKAIDQILAEKSQQAGAALCVAVLNQGLDNKGIGEFANKFADNCAKISGNGAIVFVQDVKSRKWYIATDKKMKPALGKGSSANKEHTEYISHDVVPNLKSNDLVKAYSTFADKAGELAAYYNRTGDAMEVVDTTIEKIIVLVLALVIGYFYASSRRSSRVEAMSNVAIASGAEHYLDRSTFNLYASNDSYLYQTVTVVPRSKGSSDSSDGDCSFSSSDDSHGGGGGDY